ncbi:MAG TPA: DNA translocase FtsK [Rectinemataceae bacterium]|nr:DNA translocase FtsK [Rectinemataceae bacterium]
MATGAADSQAAPDSQAAADYQAAADGFIEEGHRPGLDPLVEDLGLFEEGVPTAAGRRGDLVDEFEAVQAMLPENSPRLRDEAIGTSAFRLPEIPPLPRLRSLRGEVVVHETEGLTSAVEETRMGEIEDLPPPEELEKRIVDSQSLDDGAEEVEGADKADEAPIPLFFRGSRAETRTESPVAASWPVMATASMPALTLASTGVPTKPMGSQETQAGTQSALRDIEVVSIPPQPAAEGGGAEAARLALVERILARKKKQPYAVPVGELLLKYPDGEYWIVDDKTRRSAEVLRETLAEFGIEAEVTGIRKGPVITMFEILPAPGVRLSKIANLSDNIALRLAASSVRIVAPIPGKHAVGIEVPNERRSIVSLREIVESEVFVGAKAEVPVALGKDIAGEVQFIDLTQTPHLLIAGSTGSGKSVCVNSIILSILFRRSPEEVRLLLIDPKIVELKLYNDVPHLLTPVITEPKRAFQALQYCICEMERRYAMLDRLGVRDIRSYNRKVKEKALGQERLPYIVVIIDEFADLMATTGKELESTLARLAAMSRAVGIHLVLATQRPSIDVITGLIKANIPSRVAFMVASKFDSRIIIDMVGAEKLLGKGDMLFASAWDPFPIRMQGAFVSEEEVEKAVEYVKTLGEPEYIDDDIFIDDEEDEAEPNLFDDGDGDPLFEQALEIVLQQGKASASYIQRKLKIGYNRAARLVELMEEKGIVGKAQGSKPRDLVRNPTITGLVAAGGDSAGHTRAALRERDADADGGEDGGPLPVAARAAKTEAGSETRAASSGLPPLVPSLETLPGQRVTGRDED